MIQIDSAKIKNLIVHRVSEDEANAVFMTDLPDPLESSEENLIKKVFLKPISNLSTTMEFAGDVNVNKLYRLCQSLNDGGDFIAISESIAKHLMQCMLGLETHDGELFIIHLEDVSLNNVLYNALGIFKFEDKEQFLETAVIDEKMYLGYRSGIGTRKADLSCLVVFTEEPFTLFQIDNSHPYWKNEFIGLQPKNDFVNNTNNFLALTKKFITEQIPEHFEVTKADQIDLLNRSVDYFKNNERFEKEEFEDSVFQDEKVISSFRKFDEVYQEENEVELSASFEISPEAVKKQARVFKSVLKLDKNFHIYIHGDRQLIEKGVDDSGRKFYKIFFENEQ